MVKCETFPFDPCFTGTATGTIPTSVLSYSDYISRLEDHNSVLRFDKGETEKLCRVVVIDDSLYEQEETFNVTLSMPMGGRIGSEYPSTQITIVQDTDDSKSPLRYIICPCFFFFFYTTAVIQL